MRGTPGVAGKDFPLVDTQAQDSHDSAHCRHSWLAFHNHLPITVLQDDCCCVRVQKAATSRHWPPNHSSSPRAAQIALHRLHHAFLRCATGSSHCQSIWACACVQQRLWDRTCMHLADLVVTAVDPDCLSLRTQSSYAHWSWGESLTTSLTPALL